MLRQHRVFFDWQFYLNMFKKHLKTTPQSTADIPRSSTARGNSQKEIEGLQGQARGRETEEQAVLAVSNQCTLHVYD